MSTAKANTDDQEFRLVLASAFSTNAKAITGSLKEIATASGQPSNRGWDRWP